MRSTMGTGGGRKALFLIIIALAGSLGIGARVQAQRSLGLDISAWQGNISQTTWNNIRNVENREFVFLRSSRGGTTGYYDQSNSDNDPPTNTLSQRYDDPYFVQNINRATTAGMYAGSYHFSRPDIVATTLNSNGIANSGTDEANHFMQMAGAWMRPGYMLPVHDLEAGISQRSANDLIQFAVDFSNRVNDVMGIRPMVYTGGNYANYFQGASAAQRNALVTAHPMLWSARWPNQAAPDTIPVQTGHPKDSYTPIYGPWDDGGTTHPWHFWQYASTGRLQSFNNGGSNLDFDVAQGGVEFLRDHLVPALWTNDSSGNWNTLANWNSGLAPVAPVTGPGQVAPVGTQTLPTPRLPGAAGSGVTSGQYDTVILDRPNANITVTVASGTHNVRKLYAREALDITGGSLTVNYVPSPDSTPIGAQFSAPVSLSGGSFSAHTLQVDAGNTFAVSGGSLALNTINLAGSMSIASPLFTDISQVRLMSGGSLNLAYSGTPEAVDALYFDGVAQAAGTWGAPGSNATFTSSRITGPGLLDVGTFQPPVSGPGNVIDDFEVDEGHFNWNYNFSPSMQTFGLTGGPANVSGPSDRVTTEHQGAGVASQLLNLVATTPTTAWQLRHNSGLGSPGVPANNVALDSTGWVGFWLKTDDPGVRVQIALDDPSSADRGTLKDVIADNEWHLYQWNLEDDGQWDPWVNGDGSITGATVTIDSIFFYGTGNAQIYLDTVSHNPLGMLAAAPIPGDYNSDGVVDDADYATWRGAFGNSVTPGSGADGNGDGVVDTADYVFWRNIVSAAATSASALSAMAVPEPATAVLIILAAFALCGRREYRR